MDKEFLIKLTANLYQLTSLFPKKEPLRYKIREAGNDILASFLRSRSFPKIEKIDENSLVSGNFLVLQGFLEIARNQNWVSPSQVLNIQAEYSKLEEALRVIGERPEQNTAATLSVSLPVLARQNLNEQDSRQGKIIEFLKEKGRAQVWQLKQVFPEVSKRTLRRDFENLLKQGVVERIGERNDTFYQVKTI